MLFRRSQVPVQADGGSQLSVIPVHGIRSPFLTSAGTRHSVQTYPQAKHSHISKVVKKGTEAPRQEVIPAVMQAEGSWEETLQTPHRPPSHSPATSWFYSRGRLQAVTHI